MINILCNYWQIQNAEEFGRVFRVRNPQAFYDGKETLPHAIYEKVSNIASKASQLEKDDEVAFALQEYIDKHNVSASRVANLLGKDSETLRKWLKLDSKPNRNSVVRIASLLLSSPLEDEWDYQIGTLQETVTYFQISQKFISERLGVSQVTVGNWLRGTNTPRKVQMEGLLPWITNINEQMYKVHTFCEKNQISSS